MKKIKRLEEHPDYGYNEQDCGHKLNELIDWQNEMVYLWTVMFNIPDIKPKRGGKAAQDAMEYVSRELEANTPQDRENSLIGTWQRVESEPAKKEKKPSSSLEKKIETLIGEEAMASLYYRAGDNILQELVALIQEEIEAAQQELIDELGGIDLTIANELVALMNKKEHGE
jgi:hypothetical protein